MTLTSHLTQAQRDDILETCKRRFNENYHRHNNCDWAPIAQRLLEEPDKLLTLYRMEETGGEPDVVGYDVTSQTWLIFDCCRETPTGRRRVCYDREAWQARKNHKPETSAEEMAADMGVTLLSEDQYLYLQQLEEVDTKTSSWLQTPEDMRARGGALYGDYRFGRVFFYHNGAQSYYGGRGFRGCLFV